MFPWGVSTEHSGTQTHTPGLCLINYIYDKVIFQTSFLFTLNYGSLPGATDDQNIQSERSFLRLCLKRKQPITIGA